MFIRSTHFKYSANVHTKHDTRHYAKPLLADALLSVQSGVIPILQSMCVGENKFVKKEGCISSVAEKTLS
jgi:hypothetical protein